MVAGHTVTLSEKYKSRTMLRALCVSLQEDEGEEASCGTWRRQVWVVLVRTNNGRCCLEALLVFIWVDLPNGTCSDWIPCHMPQGWCRADASHAADLCGYAVGRHAIGRLFLASCPVCVLGLSWSFWTMKKAQAWSGTQVMAHLQLAQLPRVDLLVERRT